MYCVVTNVFWDVLELLSMLRFICVCVRVCWSFEERCEIGNLAVGYRCEQHINHQSTVSLAVQMYLF